MGRRAEGAALLALLLAGCPPAPVGAPAPAATPPPATEPPLVPAGAIAQPLPRLPAEGPVYEVPGWPARPTGLAAGDGRAALQAHCSVCHSTAYVTMQPPLTRAQWEATVTKMLKTYGAQVPDAASRQVLEYLAAHYAPETVEATYARLAGAPAADDAGARAYRATCAACHQPDGAGLPGAFPPLVGHAPALFTTRRAHAVRLVLYGQQGPIEAAGRRYDSTMPPAGHLSDAELAAVLNHVARAWGNDALLPQGFAPFTAEEVAKARGQGLTPRQVHERR